MARKDAAKCIRFAINNVEYVVCNEDPVGADMCFVLSVTVSL